MIGFLAERSPLTVGWFSKDSLDCLECPGAGLERKWARWISQFPFWVHLITHRALSTHDGFWNVISLRLSS